MSYIVSPFTPVFWKPTADKFGAKTQYVQTWAQTDRILVQCIQLGDGAPIVGKDGNVPSLSLKDMSTGNVSLLAWQSWALNEWATVKWCVITALQVGIYSLLLGDSESEPFCVSDEQDILNQTCLLQYSSKDNRQRMDAAFVVNGVRQFFDFRIPGGFIDNGWTFGVDNEQFTTGLYDTVDVHAHELVQKTLTLGNSEGVPVWFADLLNRLLTCTYVYVDQVRFSRHESDVPEIVSEMEGLRSYVFTQTLQQVVNLMPDVEAANIVRLRRVGEVQDDYRVAEIEGETVNRIVE